MKHQTLHGTIIHGDRIGRTIGFPTANLQTADPLPERGVYVARMVWKSGSGYGMLNIGTRPTVNGTTLRVEMHLLDFQGDLYGETVSVQLLHFLRQEMRFAGTEALRQQLLADRQQTEAYLHQHPETDKTQNHA
ncbi:MAG: riboflavin kinase [Bacteroidales bacterium]|nr:riboflavin kinase [Bacteroidales bacterium]